MEIRRVTSQRSGSLEESYAEWGLPRMVELLHHLREQPGGVFWGLTSLNRLGIREVDDWTAEWLVQIDPTRTGFRVSYRVPPEAGAPPGAYVKVATDDVGLAVRMVLERLCGRCEGWKFRDETERQWLQAPDEDAFALLPESVRESAWGDVLLVYLGAWLGLIDCECARRVTRLIDEGATWPDLTGFLDGHCRCPTRSLLRPYRQFLDGLVCIQEWKGSSHGALANFGWDLIRQAAYRSSAITDARDHPAHLLMHDFYPSLLREALGNPFRPPAVEPSWLARNDGAAATIARAIWQERRFSDLPILADALEEAGCADQTILDHCRRTGGHVRGCWVLRLLGARYA
jgi:hypothetical protein